MRYLKRVDSPIFNEVFEVVAVDFKAPRGVTSLNTM
jgi:hypothetical protein